nr:unnamed protein product [Callosobruchus chinensis]CAH7730380.1 unnamed protein product [Callosobruchus chinensis]CAH7731103.1 unnamed protein product [Callosobruchus chinensis]CAH7732060.1 unnamed protein product [Callosobruchus chinensis]CAH7732423.1 unnamed protein product [Callosobruchus chinensis]
MSQLSSAYIEKVLFCIIIRSKKIVTF